MGVGTGRLTLKLRAYETHHEVLERYYGSAVDVAVALVRDTNDSRRERLEVVCAPDVQLEQDVEELLFRAYSLYRQVHLTFVSGRDRALCLHMIYGVIAGLFIDSIAPPRARATRPSSARASAISRSAPTAPRPTSSARPSGARSCATWPGWAAG